MMLHPREPYALQFVSEEMGKNRDVIIASLSCMRLDPNSSDVGPLRYVSKIEPFSEDKEVIFAAVNQHGRALTYASEELQNDKKIVLAAVRNDAGTRAFLSKVKR